MPVVTQSVALFNPRDTWMGSDNLTLAYYYVKCLVDISRVRLGFYVTTQAGEGFVWLQTRFMQNGETFFIAYPSLIASGSSSHSLSFFPAVMFWPYTRRPVSAFAGEVTYFVTG